MNDTAEKTWTFGKLAEYGDGPWAGEPDKIQWIDEATGLDCLIKRNPMGALCGYVGVPPGHPWHGVGYSQCVADGCAEDYCWEHSPDAKVSVHGGLTYAAPCAEDRGDDAICHVPYPGRPADVWWFGFDCAHSGDKSPGLDKYISFHDRHDVYRTVDYVRAEVTSLAAQLVEVQS